MTFTREEKRACAAREVGFRRRVYRRRVQEGRMKPEEASREIKLMEAIERDYGDEPDLFEGAR